MADENIVREGNKSDLDSDTSLLAKILNVSQYSAMGVEVVRNSRGRITSISLTADVPQGKYREYPFGKPE